MLSVLGTQIAMVLMNYDSFKKMIPSVISLLGIEGAVTEALAKARAEAAAAGATENLTRAQTLKITLGVILAKLKEIAVDTLHNTVRKIAIVLQTILNALTGNLGPIIQIAAGAIAAITIAMSA